MSPSLHPGVATIVIGGDICPILRGGPSLLDSPPDAVFGGVMASLRRADLAVANLECPLTSGSRPIRKTGPLLRGSPGCAGRIKAAGFNLVSIANNHLRDFSSEGVLSTLSACREAGLAVVGGGELPDEAAEIVIRVVGGLRVAVMAACEHEFSVVGPGRAGANPIDPLRMHRQMAGGRGTWDALIVLLHAGKQFYPYPTPRQQELCRYLVDLGASVVVCQHSHCPGSYERYGSSLIVYGQGNLLFDWDRPVPNEWHEGFLVEARVDQHGVQGFDLIPYVQCDGAPTVDTSKLDRCAAILEGVAARTNEIRDPQRVHELWHMSCEQDRRRFLFWLTGGRWLDRQAYRLANRLRLPYQPFNAGARLRIGNLIRCESHRETLEILLDEGERGPGGCHGDAGEGTAAAARNPCA